MFLFFVTSLIALRQTNWYLFCFWYQCALFSKTRTQETTIIQEYANQKHSKQYLLIVLIWQVARYFLWSISYTKACQKTYPFLIYPLICELWLDKPQEKICSILKIMFFSSKIGLIGCVMFFLSDRKVRYRGCFRRPRNLTAVSLVRMVQPNLTSQTCIEACMDKVLPPSCLS